MANRVFAAKLAANCVLIPMKNARLGYPMGLREDGAGQYIGEIRANCLRATPSFHVLETSGYQNVRY